MYRNWTRNTPDVASSRILKYDLHGSGIYVGI
eukprot:CAMPEP_0114247014 /NCGR_PEP_ID=MMETSP0058-20121206/12787_1 /TAXON_ID=36894 /ORGANISM="Pyramimonas parkeae, CCMP726" /LENGTH=31 /DNA_ID= /DNA_START= /DNA_END= /DNA_ORIENTATION=